MLSMFVGEMWFPNRWLVGNETTYLFPCLYNFFESRSFAPQYYMGLTCSFVLLCNNFMFGLSCILSFLLLFQRCLRTTVNNNWLLDLSSSFKCQISICEYETDIFEEFISHVNSHVDCLNVHVEPVLICRWRGKT